MSYQPIENYGIIGNMRTVVLVGMNGAIDWYCYPHCSARACLATCKEAVDSGAVAATRNTAARS